MRTPDNRPQLPNIILPELYPECAGCNLAQQLIQKSTEVLPQSALVYQIEVTCAPVAGTDTKVQMSMSIRADITGDGIPDTIPVESTTVESPGRSGRYKQIIQQGPTDDRLRMTL